MKVLLPTTRNLKEALLGLALAAVCGCTPAQYAGQADRDAYRTVAETEQFSLGSTPKFDAAYRPFTVEPNQPPDTVRIGERTVSLAGGEPQHLSLDECLEIAFRNSRDLQARKEDLYAAALALANSRRGWTFPLFAGPITGDASRTHVNRGGSINAGAATGDFSLTQRLVQGTVLTLGTSLDVASDLLGLDSTAFGSLLSAGVTQPLLRGAWNGFAYEQQYRAERDFVLSVLQYDRFTQAFAVDILTRYYSVLQQRDQLENERANIQRLQQTVALTRTLVEGGQVSRIQEDQAEQNLLDARVRLEQIEQQYRDTVDRFKLTLGVPIAAQILADPNELVALNKTGPRDNPVNEPEAFDVALVTRPDVLVERSRLRDAHRDVEIATNNFLPQLDLAMGISASGTAPRELTRIQFHRHTRAVSAAFDYDLDQTDNRDAYRLALIAMDRAGRDWTEFLDALRLEIRAAYRSLVQSRHSYELQLRNVEIAQRRRKLAVLQQKEGQASARDVLESETALLDAQNGVTNALISYTTTRLQFLTTLGLVWVDERGRVHERAEPFKLDRIRGRYPYVFEP